MSIILIAACSWPDRIIGKNNQLPWDIPEEMADFRAFTLGKTVLMGRKTYEWLGRILPKRRNILLTRDPEKVQVWDFPTRQDQDGNWIVDGWEKWSIEIYISIDDMRKHLPEDADLLVLGGAEIYQLFLDVPWTLIRMSEIHEIYDGDTSFPEFHDRYEEVSREDRGKYDLVWYQRSA